MDWTRTRSVLADLGKLLTCAICNSYLKDPCTLENCDHNFCRKCIEDTLGSDSKCPECGLFSWLKDLRLNHQLAMTVNMTLKLQSLIGLNMEVEECAAPSASESLSRNPFACVQETPSENDNLEQETRSGDESIGSSNLPDIQSANAEEYAILGESDHQTNQATITTSKSGKVRKQNKKINHATVQCGTSESESELNHATIAKSKSLSENTKLKENTNGSKSGGVRKQNNIYNQTVECSTSESDGDANHIATSESAVLERSRWKQNTNGSTLGKVKNQNKIDHQTLQGNTSGSDSEANHSIVKQSTSSERTSRKNTNGGKVRKHSKVIQPTVQCNSSVSHSEANHSIIAKDAASESKGKKQNIKTSKVKKNNKKIIQPTDQYNTSESDSEANHSIITKDATSESTSRKRNKKANKVKKPNKKIIQTTVQRSSAASDSDAAASESTSRKQNTNESEVKTHSQINQPGTVQCSSCVESDREAQYSSAAESTTEHPNLKQRKHGCESVRVKKHTTTKQANFSENVPFRRPEPDNGAKHFSLAETTEENTNVRQHNTRKSARIRRGDGANIILKETTKTTRNNNVRKTASIHGRNGKSKNSKIGCTKIKQKTHTINESEPAEILETTTSVRATENPNFKEVDSHTRMEKTNHTTKASKRTTMESSSDGRLSMQTTKCLKPAGNNNTQRKDVSSGKLWQKTSEQNVHRKKYFFRSKQGSKQDSNLAREPFDFTQREDPFHFADNDDDDGRDVDADSDNVGIDNDGSDNGASDDDVSNDGSDHNNADDDNSDDIDDGSNKPSKSVHNIPLQGLKTREEKSITFEIAHDVENNNRILQRTTASKKRLHLKAKSKITAEETSKTKFTHLKERPDNSMDNDKSVDRQDTKKTSQNGLRKPDKECRGVDGEDKENRTLNIKRRRVKPRSTNIRQYLIAIDSGDVSDSSSDTAPQQKRKKLRNPSTSSSQNTQNTAPLSQCSRNKKGETPLHLAAIKGDLALARELIKDGADPNAKDHAGWTPLHEACNHGHVNIVELFLDHGALLNIPGFDNDTPLHDAVANGRLKVVKLLVARGAVLTARNKQGLLPIDYAVTKKMKAELSPRCVSSITKPELNLENVKKSEDFCRESQVILGTALNTEEKVLLKKCIRLLGGTLADEFDESVTHVVISVNEDGHCPRTIKYLSGILTGKWIVSFEWIKDCLRQRQWSDEDVYEVEGAVDTSCNVSRKARFNALQQMPRLFDGCSFFLCGVFTPPTASKEDLIKLINLGGGKVLHRKPKIKDDDLILLPSSPIVTSLSRAPEVAYHAPENSTLSCCTEFIIYDPASCDQPNIVHSPVLRTAPVTWLMDCISSFQLLDIPDK